jgi:AcrR family transcriptional regulator
MYRQAEPEPAPARGQYDRSLSRLERQQLQRGRLLFWTARQFYAHGTELTVQHIVDAAGTGRNTFYEFFDDLEHALHEAGQWAAKRIEQRISTDLAQARTSIARLKILSAAWFEAVVAEPAEFAMASRPVHRGPEPQLTDSTRTFTVLLNAALNASVRRPRRAATPWLVESIAHSATGLARWSLRGGVAAPELERPLREILLDVFR